MNKLGSSFVDEYFEQCRDTIGQCIGGVIRAITIEDENLHMRFDDGTLILHDNPSCCEARYMTCDDNLEDYIGAHFTGLIRKSQSEIPQLPDEDNYTSNDTHEVQWLEVVTSKGCFTIAAHNEHNGYYGGFDIDAVFKGE